MECLKVCDMAAARGRTIVPHCWKTGVGIAATMQMAAVTPHCAFIEYLPAEICSSKLRQELTLNEPCERPPQGNTTPHTQHDVRSWRIHRGYNNITRGPESDS